MVALVFGVLGTTLSLLNFWHALTSSKVAEHNRQAANRKEAHGEWLKVAQPAQAVLQAYKQEFLASVRRTPPPSPEELNVAYARKFMGEIRAWNGERRVKRPLG